MNTLDLFDDYTEMVAISKFAEENELTVDYVIEEFVIDNKLIVVEVENVSSRVSGLTGGFGRVVVVREK